MFLLRIVVCLIGASFLLRLGNGLVGKQHVENVPHGLGWRVENVPHAVEGVFTRALSTGDGENLPGENQSAAASRWLPTAPPEGQKTCREKSVAIRGAKTSLEFRLQA